MESYQIIDWGAPLERREYDEPAPQGTEVLMRVTGCGVCHSDLHIWEGHFDLGGGKRITLADRGLELPFTMGHEVVGEVLALGPDADGEAHGVAVGDPRVVYPWIGCGDCDACAREEDLLCLAPRTVGTRKAGGYSDRVIVPHPKYLVAYDGLPTALAATYACSGITAYSALKKAAAESGDDPVLIIGAGGVGLSAVHLAKEVVKGDIIVADVDGAKRAAARQAGAVETIDNSEAGALDKIRELTGGGVAAAIDFVGRPETSEFGFEAIRRGGSLVVVGLFGDSMPLSLALMPLKMATIKGSYVGTLDDLKEVIALAQAGKVPPIPIETRPLSAAHDTLEDMKEGRYLGRVVLTP